MTLKGPQEQFIVYVRQSTAGQEDNTSAEDQLERGRRFGEEKGWKFHSYVYDNGTGKASAKDRKNLQSVIDTVQSGVVKHVVFNKVSRAARDVQVFKDICESIYAAKGDVSIAEKGRHYTSYWSAREENFIDSVFAEWDANNIAKTLREGRLAQFRKGSIIYQIPYGYISARDTTKDKKFRIAVIDPEATKAVQAIIRAFITTKSISSTVKAVNQQGLKSKHGKPFSITVITNILENADRYAGKPHTFEYKVPHETEVYSNDYSLPPIITEEEYIQVKNNLVLRSRAVLRNKPFEKSVICIHCGAMAFVSKLAKDPRKKHNKIKYRVQCRNALYARKKGYEEGGDASFDIHPCRGEVRHSTIADAVLKFLSNDSEKGQGARFESEIGKLLFEAATVSGELNDMNGVRENMIREKETILENSTKIIEQAADISSIMPIINAYSKKVEVIDEQLSELAEHLSTVQAELKTMTATLSLLGLRVSPEIYKEVRESYSKPLESFYTQEFPSIVTEAAETLKAASETLATAIQGEDWEKVNSLMMQLGLRVMVDFSEKDVEARRAGIRVEADFSYVEVTGASELVKEAQSYLTTAPWLVLAPGTAILLTSLGFNLLGEGLRDALDPKGGL